MTVHPMNAQHPGGPQRRAAHLPPYFDSTFDFHGTWQSTRLATAYAAPFPLPCRTACDNAWTESSGVPRLRRQDERQRVGAGVVSGTTRIRIYNTSPARLPPGGLPPAAGTSTHAADRSAVPDDCRAAVPVRGARGALARLRGRRRARPPLPEPGGGALGRGRAGSGAMSHT